MLSVVIPTLNVAASLPSVLMALYEPALDGLVRQVVIADGGSTDPTLKVADDAGCDVVRARPGRGIQLATGARKARADWLLFLHADTVLQPGWEAEVLRFINRHGPEKAAAFRFSLDDDRLRAVAAAVDDALCANFHYAYCRRLGQLGPVAAYRVAGDGRRIYVDACVARGRRAGDVKPALLSPHGDWLTHFTGALLD